MSGQRAPMDPAVVSNFPSGEGLPATAQCMRLVVHASHAAPRHRRVGSLFLWPLGDHRLGSNQKTCDRGSTLQSIAHHLRWIDDTLAREIPVFAGLRVVAKGIGRPVEDLADHHRAVLTCVDREYGDLTSQGVIDPTKVVRNALQGAASIAGLLITTEAMVAERPKKEGAHPPMPGGGMGGMDY